MQFAERHPALLELVGGDRGGATAAGDDDDLFSEILVKWDVRQQLDCLDELVVGIGRHNSAAA